MFASIIHHPYFHHTCTANLGNLTHWVCSRSMKQRYVMIEFQISFQFLKRKASNYWESEQVKKNIREHFFDLSKKSLFLYFNEAREQMESSSSILSPIFLAEHHSPEYLSMSLFRFLNSWKVWKEKKGENINSWRPSLPGGCRPVPSGATITPAGRENTLYPTCQTCWYQ